jgi:hypothetical protein
LMRGVPLEDSLSGRDSADLTSGSYRRIRTSTTLLEAWEVCMEKPPGL